jgi:hypothetical protein
MNIPSTTCQSFTSAAIVKTDLRIGLQAPETDEERTDRSRERPYLDRDNLPS